MLGQNSLNYNRIVSAVAMHVEGHPAVVRAINVAQRFQANVTLVHSFFEMPLSEKIEPAHRMKGTSEGEARLQLENLKTRHPEVDQAKFIVGGQWSSIIDLADEVNADLVVIGSYVHGQLSSLLGETSDRVLHHTHRDVLVVRSENYSNEILPTDFKHILVAVDVDDEAHVALDRAIGIAQNYRAKMTLLNVIEHFPTDRENDHITPENQDPMEYQITLRMRKLAALSEERGFSEADKQVIPTTQSAKFAVPTFAKEVGADLVVTGSHETRGLGALLGMTADGIIHHSSSDILVVHEP